MVLSPSATQQWSGHWLKLQVQSQKICNDYFSRSSCRSARCFKCKSWSTDKREIDIIVVENLTLMDKNKTNQVKVILKQVEDEWFARGLSTRGPSSCWWKCRCSSTSVNVVLKHLLSYFSSLITLLENCQALIGWIRLEEVSLAGLVMWFHVTGSIVRLCFEQN